MKTLFQPFSNGKSRSSFGSTNKRRASTSNVEIGKSLSQMQGELLELQVVKEDYDYDDEEDLTATEIDCSSSSNNVSFVNNTSSTMDRSSTNVMSKQGRSSRLGKGLLSPATSRQNVGRRHRKSFTLPGRLFASAASRDAKEDKESTEHSMGAKDLELSELEAIESFLKKMAAHPVGKEKLQEHIVSSSTNSTSGRGPHRRRATFCVPQK